MAKAEKTTKNASDINVDVVIPSFGESISEASVLSVLCKNGDAVKKDQILLELETDKVTVEVYAPCDGIAEEISLSAGDTVNVGDIAMKIDSSKAVDLPKGNNSATNAVAADVSDDGDKIKSVASSQKAVKTQRKIVDASLIHASPSAVRLASDLHLDIAEIKGTGKNNLVTKEDIENAANKGVSGHASAVPSGGLVNVSANNNASKNASVDGGLIGGNFVGSGAAKGGSLVSSGAAKGGAIKNVSANVNIIGGGRDAYGQIERVRMSRLRQTIATRLKDVQNTAAILTTFNEVDMTNLINLRTTHKEEFEKKHGVKLGFMSFFSKACAIALQEIPEVNAEIDGEDLIYKNYYNIGVAVGTEKGLIVPVVKNVNLLSLAQIEAAIAMYAKKARDGKIEIADLQGGTFTISNGGVYGSMMSTPILNSPQSGILGLHNIVKRPVVINDAIEIRSMMYLALSYDHRVVDGKSAVTFLVKIKNMIEDPSRLMLNI